MTGWLGKTGTSPVAKTKRVIYPQICQTVNQLTIIHVANALVHTLRPFKDIV